jgi:hypothetical protein
MLLNILICKKCIVLLIHLKLPQYMYNIHILYIYIYVYICIYFA